MTIAKSEPSLEVNRPDLIGPSWFCEMIPTNLILASLAFSFFHQAMTPENQANRVEMRRVLDSVIPPQQHMDFLGPPSRVFATQGQN